MIWRREQLLIETSGRGLSRVDRSLNDYCGDISIGLCHLFIAHTSASLIVMENADPDVLTDLETFMSDLVRDGDARYRHRAEGPDDMAAHVRNVLTLTDVSVPIEDGRLVLGTWQGIYLWEHRHAPHRRRLVITLQGES